MFFNFFLEDLRSNKLEQLKLELEKNISIQKHAFVVSLLIDFHPNLVDFPDQTVIRHLSGSHQAVVRQSSTISTSQSCRLKGSPVLLPEKSKLQKIKEAFFKFRKIQILNAYILPGSLNILATSILVFSSLSLSDFLYNKFPSCPSCLVFKTRT